MATKFCLLPSINFIIYCGVYLTGSIFYFEGNIDESLFLERVINKLLIKIELHWKMLVMNIQL